MLKPSGPWESLPIILLCLTEGVNYILPKWFTFSVCGVNYAANHDLTVSKTAELWLGGFHGTTELLLSFVMDTAEHDRAVSMVMLICKYLNEFPVLFKSILGHESAGKFGKKSGENLARLSL